MPFAGESRPDPEDGFTRQNPADNQFYATPTIFNPANFPWLQPDDNVPGESWPREVWPASRIVRDRWREVIETRERDRQIIKDEMKISYIDRMLLATPESTQDIPEFTCTLCLEDLQEGDTAVRLDCTHAFHADCINRMVQNRLATALETVEKTLRYAAAQYNGESFIQLELQAHVLPHRCPNCKVNEPQVIAIWDYQVQRSAAARTQAPRLEAALLILLPLLRLRPNAARSCLDYPPAAVTAATCW